MKAINEYLLEAKVNLSDTEKKIKEQIDYYFNVCLKETHYPKFEIKDEDDVNLISVYEIDIDDWRQSLIDFLEYEKLPNDVCHKIEVKRRPLRFIYYKGTLYRCSFNDILLRCLGE